jgi:transposase
MPWKECHVMDERLRFVARLLEGEKMAPLCAEFGISRKTGYKIFDRYKDCGVVAFSDRSRRPYRQANRLPAPIEATIVRLKREYPGWGAPKIREKLRQQQARFDTFVAQYNRERPHQALDMKYLCRRSELLLM